MPQVRLQNRTGRRVIDGELVRLFPGTTTAFIVANLNEFGIIGSVSGIIDTGQVGNINLINTVEYSKILDLPPPPKNIVYTPALTDAISNHKADASAHHVPPVAGDFDHNNLANIGANDHHAPTVAGDLSHNDLNGIGVSDHHVRYTDAEAQAAVAAADDYLLNTGDVATGNYIFDNIKTSSIVKISSTFSSPGSGVARTFYTLSVPSGIYIISIFLSGDLATDYAATAMIFHSGAAVARIIWQLNGTYVSITLNNLEVRITTTVLGAQLFTYKILCAG